MTTATEKTSLIKVGEEVQKVKAFFNTPAIKEGLQKALPQAGVSFERLMSTLVACVHKNPGLLLCERGSLFQSVVRAAQMGLEIDSPLGHAYLIPFKSTFSGSKGSPASEIGRLWSASHECDSDRHFAP